MLLDFLITFVAYIIWVIKSIVGGFVFRPPSPAGYKTQLTRDDDTIKEKVLILKRGKNPVYDPVEFSTVKHEYLKVPDENGSYIPVIYIKPNNPFKLCIIYSHGNSCDIGISFFECVDISLNTNCNVLIYEYPSYGLCHNKKLSEENVCYNIRKVYNYAKNELGFNQEEIILYGHSLGTGPSIDLAADENYPISALILQAPFLSILRTVADLDRTVFFDYFPNVDKVSRLKSPTLIIHGTKDNIIPVEDGEKLSSLIPQEFLFDFFQVKDGDHNDIIKDHKTVVYKKIRDFLEYATKINFSFKSDTSKNEINSDYFKKLHPFETIHRAYSDKLGEREPFNFLLENIVNDTEMKHGIMEVKSTENVLIPERKNDVQEQDIILVMNEKEKFDGIIQKQEEQEELHPNNVVDELKLEENV